MKTIRIKAKGAGFAEDVQGKTLCKMKDTGNGFITKFPSFSSVMQDYYVCLDYAQAADLYKALRKVRGKLK